MSRLFGLAHTTAATLAVSSAYRLFDYSRTDWAPDNTSQSAIIFTAADGKSGQSDEDVAERERESEIEVYSSMYSSSKNIAPSSYDEIVEHIAKQSDLMNSFLPANYRPADREMFFSKVINKVRGVLADDHFMAEITADHLTTIPPTCEAPKNDTRTWDDLVNDHKCMICSDLLAGPVILGCSHSFCGICLHEMRDSWESDDSDVRYSCPTCRNEIENEIFERLLDDIIAQKVSLVPDCEAKNDWILRRDAYIKYQRKTSIAKELRKGRVDDTDSEDEFYVVAAAMVIIALIIAAGVAAVAQSRSAR